MWERQPSRVHLATGVMTLQKQPQNHQLSVLAHNHKSRPAILTTTAPSHNPPVPYSSSGSAACRPSTVHLQERICNFQTHNHDHPILLSHPQ